MKKRTIIPCLLAMIYATSAADVSAAETCIIPPTCAALGFTKTETDCKGLDLLRCPLDQAKVFCSKTSASGGESLDEGGSTNTYELGSKYYDNKGNFIGYLIDGLRVFSLSQETFTKYEDIRDYCKNKTTGGLTWLPVEKQNNMSGVPQWFDSKDMQSFYDVVKGKNFVIGTSYYISTGYSVLVGRLYKNTSGTITLDSDLHVGAVPKPTMPTPMSVLCYASIKSMY